MKQNQSLNRLRKSLLAGIASVSLVAVGCGGGSGTVTPSSTPLMSIFSNGSAAVEVYDVTGGTAASGSRVSTGTLTAGGLSVATLSALTTAADTWYLVRAQSGQGRVSVFMTGSEIVTGGPTAHLNFSAARVAASYQLVNESPSYSIGTINPAGVVNTMPALTSAEKQFLVTATSSAFVSNPILNGFATAINEVVNGTSRFVATTSPTQVPFDTVVEGIVNGQSIDYVAITDANATAVAAGNASVGTVGGLHFARLTLTGTNRPFASEALLRAASRANRNIFRVIRNRGSFAGTTRSGLDNLITAQLSATTADLATQVAAVGSTVVEAVDLATVAGGTASTNLLTSVLANVSVNPATVAANSSAVATAVENNLSAVVDAVASNPATASNAAATLGGLAGNLLANGRAVTSPAIAKVVELASNDVLLPDASAAQLIAGSILASAGTNGVAAAAQASFFQAVTNIANDRPALGNVATLIADSINAIVAVAVNTAAQVFANVVSALSNSSVVAAVGGNASGAINNLVDKALSSTVLGSSALGNVLSAAGQGSTAKLAVAISPSTTVNLKRSTSAQTVVFTNNSKSANVTPSYVWTVSPTTSPVSSFTSTTAPGTFSVTFAANATGSATVSLQGSGTGVASQLATVMVNIAETIPAVGTVVAPSSVTSGVAFTITYSIRDVEATTGATVSISGASSQAWTVDELKSGATKTATVTLNTLGANTVAIGYNNQTVASATVTVRTFPYAITPAAIGTAGVVEISGTTTALTLTAGLLDANTTTGSSNYRLSVLPATASCPALADATSGSSLADVIGTATGAASPVSLSISANLSAGNSYKFCALAQRGTSSSANERVFTVRQAAAPVVSSVTVAGGNVQLGRGTSVALTNASTTDVAVSLTVSGVVTNAMINYSGAGTGSASLTTGTGTLTGTLSSLAASATEYLVQITLYGPNGEVTTFPFGLTITNTNVVNLTGFSINGQALNLTGVSNGQLGMTTNGAVANNNSVVLGVSFDDASRNSTGINGGLSITLTDVNATTGATVANGATASLTVSGVRLVYANGAWGIVAQNSTNFMISASATGRGGTPTGSGSSTETAGTLVNYFGGTSSLLNINLHALRDRLGTLSNLSALNSITTPSGQSVRVQVSFTTGANEELRNGGVKVTSALVNGVMVQ